MTHRGENFSPGEVLRHAAALAPARVHWLRPPCDGAKPGEVSVKHPGVIPALIGLDRGQVVPVIFSALLTKYFG